MPNRLAIIRDYIIANVADSEQRESIIQSLEGAKEDFELLEFKVNKYTSEKDVVIRMLENNVWETQEQKTELEEINRLLVQKKSQIEKQNKELEHAMKMAKEGMKVKSDFLSTMSHEIRSPLNAIIGMSYILLQDEPKPEQVKNLNILKFSAENLLSLINDILDYSKIEAGKIEFENKEFDLKIFIEQTIGMFNVRAQEKNIKLRFVMDSALPQQIKGDPTRLGQILNNLLSNAIKFTDKGSVTLEVSLVQKDSYKAKIEFSVIDTGIGIENSKQDTIFERFLQEDNETAKIYGGTGLGLSIIKNLLIQMGSEINLISEKGRGANFYFALDFDIPDNFKLPVSINSNTSPKDYKKLHGYKVLLVDDNEFNIVVAKTYLENWGIHVDIAKDGMPGLEKARQNTYDLILMDLQMPQMNGIEAALEIRKGVVNKFTPIIALTATVTTTIRKEVVEGGMDDYLSKPFNPADLHQKLHAYLEKGMG